MTDTPPEIERMVRERIMARSAEERLLIGAQMFDAAVTMIQASFPPDMPEAERKQHLFRRLYGDTTLSGGMGFAGRSPSCTP